MRLALADALDLGRMQAPDLAAALALTVLQNRLRPPEDHLELFLAGDLASDVANGSAEIGLEPAQRLVGPLELVWMPAVLQGEH